MIKYFHSLLLLAIVLCSNCYKDDMEAISNTGGRYQYSPEFALSIAEVKLPVNELVNKLDIKENDSSFVNDTLVDIFFNNISYENPVVIDTTFLIDFSLQDLNEQTEFIKELTIRLNITNGIPFEIKLNPAFKNRSFSSSKQLLFQNGPLHIAPAPINGKGEVTGNTLSFDNDAYFDSTAISQLHNVRHIELTVRIDTDLETMVNSVVLNPDFDFNIQVAARFKISQNFTY